MSMLQRKRRMEMKKASFKDEWIKVEILYQAIVDGRFKEEDWINKIIAWGETAFIIKKEEISKTYYINFAGKTVMTGIESFIEAYKKIEEKDWDIVRVVSAIMADYMIWEKEQKEVETNKVKLSENIIDSAINNKIKTTKR